MAEVLGNGATGYNGIQLCDLEHYWGPILWVSDLLLVSGLDYLQLLLCVVLLYLLSYSGCYLPATNGQSY